MQISPYRAATAAMILDHAGKQLGNQRYIDTAKELGIENRSGFSDAPVVLDVLYYHLIN